MKALLFILMLFLTLMIGCSKEKKAPSQDKIAKVYVDLLISEETSYSKEVFQEKRDSILKSYSLTDQEYKDALKHYAQKPEVWQDIFKQSNEYLSSIRDSIKKSKNDTTK